MLLVIVVRLLEWLLRLMLVVMIVRVAFPPTAVYHTSKMHSHRGDVCVCVCVCEGEGEWVYGRGWGE